MNTGLRKIIGGGVAFLAASAGADTIRVEPGQFQAGNGGEFRITTLSGYAGVTGDPGPNQFHSFCLERTAPIVLGGGSSGNANVYDFTMGTAANPGGAGGPSPDPISAGTAYLFTQFREGTLADYSFNGTAEERKADALALQVAIWTLENEYGGVVPVPTNAQATAWVNAALAAVAGSWGDTIGNVRVLTLTQGGNEAQDMLTLIPLPASAWMGLASLAGVGVMHVRRRNRAQTTLA